jgi:long-chain acyl-CoA synthetase
VNLVHELLEERARLAPDSIFLIAEGDAHTFADLDARSRGIAAGLRTLGVRAGDRVAIVLPNSTAFVASLFGVLKAGAVVVALNPDTTAERLAFVLADCEVRAVIATATLRTIAGVAVATSESVVAVVWDGTGSEPGDLTLDGLAASDTTDDVGPPRIDADLAAIIYTSGSTGTPKGAMLTHRNLRSSAASIASYLENTADDVVAGILPMSFGYGMQQVLVGAQVGYSILVERSFAFPVDVMARIVDQRVTGLPGVPSLFSAILGLPHLAELDLSAVRYLTNAAANLPVPFIPRLQAAFPRASLFCMYGLTECTRVSYLDPARLHDKAGSVGTAIPNMEAWVQLPDGRPAAPGEVGELVVRGSGVMPGYWRRPAETAEALRPGPLGEDRVLHTGDQFRTDVDGFLYFVGRTDDVFKTRGEKVAPREIEAVLYELDTVAEAVVIGVPHELDGQAVKAFIVPRPGAILDEAIVRRHCRSRLPSHLVPRFVEVRDSLPRTESGKIRRTELA